jgi:gliding motility-associated-like protein
MVARDFENPADNGSNNVYNITITATDDDGNDATMSWTVTVDDVNETANFTIDDIADAHISENSAYISVLPVLSGDTPIGSITYTLGGTDAGLFSIDAGTGVVSMIARNYENPADNGTNNSYELTIIVTDDDNNSDSEDWIVYVQDVLETANFTINNVSDANVDENVAYNNASPGLTGDTPIGTLVYTLSGVDGGLFTIDPGTGEVDMIARDYESPDDNGGNNVYDLTITATDSDGNDATMSWAVTVDDVNETANFTLNAISDINVNENSVYTSVLPVLVGDTPIGSITYTVGGTDGALFSINATTGVVQMVARDYETPVDNGTNNTYELTITATDEDGNDAQESWIVTVQDVIESSSFTINEITDASVIENTIYNSVTPAITGSPIGDLIYTLGGIDGALFSIDSGTGDVSMVARNYENAEDGDGLNTYEITITATDEDNNSDIESWTVTVTDDSEVAAFTIGAISDVNINENIAYTSVIPVISGDTPIGTLIYTLSGVDAALFTINAINGQVDMIARDYENSIDDDTNNDYEVVIVATDSDNNTASQNWIVNVVDVLETANFDIDIINDVSVPENNLYSSVLPNLNGDTPIGGSVTYTLGGTDASLFSINSVTGRVQMIARDYENPLDNGSNNTYEVSIIATDADNNSDSEDWIVTITDVVEIASFSIQTINNISVQENNLYTSVTPAISGSPIGSVTYSLSGVDAGYFSIDPSTGVVSMVARNYESPDDANALNDYELTIIATDDDGNDDEESWIVTITDEIESAVFTINSIADFDVNENIAYTSVNPVISGTYIGNIVYTISGTDAGYFSIDPSTGVVSMVARNYESPDDANALNDYELTITATDSDGNDAQESWIVRILDVVEIVSFSIDEIVDFSINENTGYSSLSPSITGSPIGNITYSIIGTDAADFVVNPLTGIVTMVGRNYENPEDDDLDNIYEITLVATDEDNNTDSEGWIVTIKDVTEIVTITLDNIADDNVDENSPYTSPSPVLTGTPIGDVIYTIYGNDASDFTVDPITGIVSMVARNFEGPEDNDLNNFYEITLIVTDEDNNTDSVDWTVEINDLVEIVAFDIDHISDLSINENIAYTSVVPSITGAPVGTVVYSLAGADSDDFSINSATGQLNMLAQDFENPLDANADNSYEVTIIATDDDSNADIESWIVTVLDITELASFDINSIKDTSVVEGFAYISVNPVLNGDTPIGDVTFTLAGADAADFIINSSTGIVEMVAREYNNPVDDNTDNTYELEIIATDSDGNFANESWTVSVLLDTDGDGISDDLDTDDDNDGNPDITDPNPLAPTANDDIMTVTEGLSATINILTNDDFLSGVNTAIGNLDTGTANGIVVFDSSIGEMTYTPSAGEERNIVTVKYVVLNFGVIPAVKDSATIFITVEPADYEPIAVDDFESTNEDTEIIVDILANDIELDDGGIVVSILEDPTKGTYILNVDNTISYIPEKDFYGADSLTYQVCDIDNDCSTAKLYFTVDPVNDYTPVAVDDSRATIINNSVDVNVLLNDTGLEDGEIAISVIAAPTNGMATVNPDSTIKYTPNTDFSGSDSFEYQICDRDSECATATVNINVKTTNAEPDAVDDDATTIMDQSVMINVLSNDLGLEDGGITVNIYSSASNGTAILNADNTITYTPNASYIGADSFQYILSDIDGDNDMATVNITVTAVPDYLPVAVDDARGTVINTEVDVDVLINDTGLEDGGLVLTITSNASNGTATVNPDNTIKYIPNNDYLGSDSFEYQVCDADGDCSIARVTITVKLTNSVPVAVNDVASTLMNTAVDINVLNNDTGMEDGGIVVNIFSTPANGNAVVNADKTITYTPNNWYKGSDSFQYLVKDIEGDQSIATVDVTITETPNYIPVANNDSRGTSTNTDVIVDILTNDIGLEDGGLVVIITSVASNGTAIVNGDNTITYSPTVDYTGTDSFEYQVCDADGECATAIVTITVKENNFVPNAIDDNASTVMNSSVDVNVLSNDTNLDDGGITVTVSENPANGTLVVNGDNTITYTPYNWYQGNDSFKYRVEDAEGDYDIATVNVTINEIPNYIPEANDDFKGTSLEIPVIVYVLTNDTGLEDGVKSLMLNSKLPDNGTAVVNADNTITYTPDNGFMGIDIFEYQVCDNDDECSTAEVSITVREVNHNPDAIDDKVFTNKDTEVVIDVIENDLGLEDGLLSVVIELDAVNGTVVINPDNTISYTPESWFEGTDNFSYKVIDTDGDYDIANVEVIVMTGTLPKVIVSGISENTNEDGTQTSFTIVLATQPSSDVNIDLNSTDLTEGIVSSTRLTFTDSDWDQAKTVTITGQDDFIDDGDITYHIITDNVVSSDSYYNGLGVANIDVINIDNDTARIDVIISNYQTSEDLLNTSFDIVLNSEPESNVEIQISTSDDTEGTLDIDYIEFTSENWNTLQRVEVIAQDEEEVDGDVIYNIKFDVLSNDPNYSVDLDSLVLTNLDNDVDVNELFIPDAFSPDGDEYNNYFYINGLERFDKVEVKIFNRWGSLVYKENNYKNNWDGKTNVGSTIGDENLPTGTYFYVINIIDENREFSGYIFLKR